MGVNGVSTSGALVSAELERLEVPVESAGSSFSSRSRSRFWLGTLLMVGALLMVGYWLKEILLMDRRPIETRLIDLRPMETVRSNVGNSASSKTGREKRL